MHCGLLSYKIYLSVGNTAHFTTHQGGYIGLHRRAPNGPFFYLKVCLYPDKVIDSISECSNYFKDRF